CASSRPREEHVEGCLVRGDREGSLGEMGAERLRVLVPPGSVALGLTAFSCLVGLAIGHDEYQGASFNSYRFNHCGLNGERTLRPAITILYRHTVAILFSF